MWPLNSNKACQFLFQNIKKTRKLRKLLIYLHDKKHLNISTEQFITFRGSIA